ncbi:hypothetical protein [Dyadobacter fanqingshengii]|uniref:Uncharacterized protein n=1 Tax=Dyadobacter fanqingshengii TaxID=2906443 RepID=A0A9X1P6N3_9BACT|nr:hypothetical protein [Dyadobacter fanqingshengii]MCF0038669.1 hypothetical protein [Dyadobacter fanqingshengii]USJ34498.1 hypothetical protein NFI81_17505 [Dyadobacter fanqingshengii]
MKTEKLIIVIIFLGLIQLAACERSKLNDPEPSSLRAGADSLGNFPGDSIPGDSIPGDSIFVPDTLKGGGDGLNHVDTTSRQAFKAGDEFLITPAILQDSLAYLRLKVVTKKPYNCRNNQISYSAMNNFGTIDVRLNEVLGGFPCEAGTAPSEATIYLDRNNISPDSTYQLHVSAGGKNFQGTLRKLGAGYEISWPYDNEVIFTKKSL